MPSFTKTLAVVTALVLAACGRAALAQPTEVHVGTVLSLEGRSFANGIAIKRAYEMYVRHINENEGGVLLAAAGGARVPFRLTVLNDKSNATYSGELVDQLLDGSADAPVALLGSMGNEFGLRQALVAKERGVPIMTPSVSGPGVYDQAEPWLYGLLPALPTASRFLMDTYAKQMDLGAFPKPMTVAAIMQDTNHGVAFMEGVNAGVEAWGADYFVLLYHELVPHEQFTSAEEFEPWASRARRSGADLLMINQHLADYDLMLEELWKDKFGFKSVSFGVRGPNAPVRTRLGSKSDGIVSFQWWTAAQQDAESVALKTMWNEYQEHMSYITACEYIPPRWHVAHAYIAARTLVRAVERAGDTNSTAIRVELAATNDTWWHGQLAFTESGQAAYSPAVVQNKPWADGGGVSILEPSSLATAAEMTVLEPWSPDYREVGTPLQAGLDTAAWLVCAVALAAAAWVIAYRRVKVVRAASWRLMTGALVSCAACAASLTLFSGTPASASTCEARVWLTPLAVAGLFGCLLAKTWRIKVIFGGKAIKVVSVSDKKLFVGVGAVMLAYFAVSAAWQATDAPALEVFPDPDDPDTRYTVCSSSSTLSGVFFGLTAVMLLFGSLLAFDVRNAPAQFNEAKFLAVIIYNSLLSMIILVAFQGMVDETNVDGIATLRCTLGLLVLAATMALLVGPKVHLVHVLKDESANRANTTTLSKAEMTACAQSPRSRGSGTGGSHASGVAHKQQHYRKPVAVTTASSAKGAPSMRGLAGTGPSSEPNSPEQVPEQVNEV